MIDQDVLSRALGAALADAMLATAAVANGVEQ